MQVITEFIVLFSVSTTAEMFELDVQKLPEILRR